MEIGIDLDGTCFPFTELLIDFVEKKTGIKYNIPPEFEMWRGWKITRERWFELYEEFVLNKGLEIADIYPNVVSTLKYLHEQGHHIHIITHRLFPDKGSKLRTMMIYSTVNWLEKMNVYYDSLLIMKDKGLVQLDVLVDDAVHNLEKVHAHTIPLCIKQPWNHTWKKKVLYKGLEIPNRFDNIKEIIPVINKIDKLKNGY